MPTVLFEVLYYYLSVQCSLIICSSHWADVSNSASLLSNAVVVQNANSFAISIQNQIKEKFKVGVQHKVDLAVDGVLGFPLPVLMTISKACILRKVLSKVISLASIFYLSVLEACYSQGVLYGFCDSRSHLGIRLVGLFS